MTINTEIVIEEDMPRGFTEQEKLNIRARLIKGGRKAFGIYGIRKTSLEDLARQAGISKGAFYHFFDSKEDLYFSVIREYEKAQHGKIYELVSGDRGNEKELLKKVFLEIIRQVDSDPFVKRLLAKDEFDYLWQKFTPEQLEEAMTADFDFAEQLIENWRKKGKLLIDVPKLVTGVFRSIVFLFLHKDEIGKDSFPAVIELMLDSSLDRLIKE